MLTQRTVKGSALAEFGPALGMLLICFFFPLINILGLFTAYGACQMLNSVQCREAAYLSESKAQDRGGEIRKAIPERWMKQGIGRFAGVDTLPGTEVTHSGTKPNRVVTVVTTMQCRPLVIVPLPIKVPGMNAPVGFQIESWHPVESATDRT